MPMASCSSNCGHILNGAEGGGIGNGAGLGGFPTEPPMAGVPPAFSGLFLFLVCFRRARVCSRSSSARKRGSGVVCPDRSFVKKQTDLCYNRALEYWLPSSNTAGKENQVGAAFGALSFGLGQKLHSHILRCEGAQSFAAEISDLGPLQLREEKACFRDDGDVRDASRDAHGRADAKCRSASMPHEYFTRRTRRWRRGNGCEVPAAPISCSKCGRCRSAGRWQKGSRVVHDVWARGGHDCCVQRDHHCRRPARFLGRRACICNGARTTWTPEGDCHAQLAGGQRGPQAV